MVSQLYEYTVVLVERLHIAPELNGVIVASFPGDIYALGIVAYEVLHKMFVQDVVNQNVRFVENRRYYIEKRLTLHG